MHSRGGMYSKAKIFGYPIHVMLVPFPIAFYTATLIGYIAYAATMDPFWFRLAVVANIAGVVGAVMAAVPGFIDWAFGIPTHNPAKLIGLFHMLSNVSALACFGANAYFQYQHWNDAQPPYMLAVALASIGAVLTVIAGSLGAQLLVKRHVGVELTPEQERIEMIEINTQQATRTSVKR